MFTRIDKDQIIEYHNTINNKIQKISFDQTFSLNSLSLRGKFPVEKLKKYDRGGSILISKTFIIITTKSVPSDEISDIFDILAIDEPGIKDIKIELLAIVDKTREKKEINKEPLTSTQPTLPQENANKTKKNELLSLGIFNSENSKVKLKNQFYFASYSEEDVREMFKEFSDCDYKFDQISTKTTNSFRTTHVHYRDKNILSYNQGNVCRTTMTIPGSKCSYIECRTTPYQNYGGKQEKMETRRWSIGFSSDEKADDFLNLIYLDEFICKQQKKFDLDYQRQGTRVAYKYKNIIHVDNTEINKVLDILVSLDYCIKTAVQQQNAVLNEILTKDEPKSTNIFSL